MKKRVKRKARKRVPTLKQQLLSHAPADRHSSIGCMDGSTIQIKQGGSMNWKKEYDELQTKYNTLEQVNKDLEAKLAAISANTKKTKGQEQAEAGYAILQKGPASASELTKATGAKSASDVVYYVRKLMKVDVVTVRQRGQETVYRLSTNKVEGETETEKKPVEAEQPAATEIPQENQPAA